MEFDEDLHHRMNRLVGTWQTEGRIVDGGEHNGKTWAGYDIYEWFPGKRQMVHRVDVEMFGGRKEAMEFFTPCDGSADTLIRRPSTAMARLNEQWAASTPTAGLTTTETTFEPSSRSTGEGRCTRNGRCVPRAAPGRTGWK